MPQVSQRCESAGARATAGQRSLGRGIYLPSEASGYLLATLPWDRYPPTCRRLGAWARAGLLAPGRERRPVGRPLLDFDDLVACQAITLLLEAGVGRPAIQKVVDDGAAGDGVVRLLAHATFWSAGLDLLRRAALPEGTCGGRRRVVWELLDEWLSPAALHLEFSSRAGWAVSWRPVRGVQLRPGVQFGQPCVEGTRVPTRAVWRHHRGGEPAGRIAYAFGLGLIEVERALQWETGLLLARPGPGASGVSSSAPSAERPRRRTGASG